LNVIAILIIQFPRVEESSYVQKKYNYVVDIVLQEFFHAKKGSDTKITVPKTRVGWNISLV